MGFIAKEKLFSSNDEWLGFNGGCFGCFLGCVNSILRCVKAREAFTEINVPLLLR